MENIKYKNILLKFRELFLENLDPNEVSRQLVKAGVLTSDEKEKIEENPSQREKVEELLMMLATKGPRAYEEFVKVLEEDHCFLACQLLKEGMYSRGQHEIVYVVISKFLFWLMHTSMGGFVRLQLSTYIACKPSKLDNQALIMTSHFKRTTISV